MRFLALLWTFLFVLSVTTLFLPAQPVLHQCASRIPPALPATPQTPLFITHFLLINEVLSHPKQQWDCAKTGSANSTTPDGWIEIYNPQASAFDLYAVHASIDEGPMTQRLYLSPPATIAARGYLIVFYSANQLHTMNKPTRLRLLFTDQVIDDITLPSLEYDQSYVRLPDGGSDWQITDTPTINSSNTVVAASMHSPTPSKSFTPSSPGTQTRDTNGEPDTSHSIPLIDGTQPLWETIHLPLSYTVTPVSTSSMSSSQEELLKNSQTSIPKRIIFSILAIIVTLALYYGWRFLSKRYTYP